MVGWRWRLTEKWSTILRGEQNLLCENSKVNKQLSKKEKNRPACVPLDQTLWEVFYASYARESPAKLWFSNRCYFFTDTTLPGNVVRPAK